MTRLKVAFRIPSSEIAKLKNDIQERAAGDVVSSFFDTFYETSAKMQSQLNEYERYLMGKRDADPVLGKINTAEWYVSFVLFKRRKYNYYGRYFVTNRQRDTVYRYSNYQPPFRVGRGVNPKIFPIRQRRVWTMSGKVGNLAAVRYAVSYTKFNNSSLARYIFPTARPTPTMVYPRNKRVIVFYSHRYNGFVFVRRRFYSSGGHESYRKHIDDIIVRNVEGTVTDYQRYASKRIRLLESSK